MLYDKARKRGNPMFRIAVVGIVAVCLSAGTDAGLEPGEGFVDVEGGEVWYRIVGSGSATPLLLLHGGPGAPSYYLNPMERVAADRPVIFYDQLWAGRSPAPADRSLWTVERFVKELAQVRAALGLDEVHILGHSWGSMLAMEYMLTEPEGVKSLVPGAAMQVFEESAHLTKLDQPDVYAEAIRNFSTKWMGRVNDFGAVVRGNYSGCPSIWV